MKTWIRLYNEKGDKYLKDINLNGRWSLESIQKYIDRRPWLGQPAEIVVKYI